MTWDDYGGVPVAVFQSGDIFGEFEAYKGCARLFSVVSVSNLHVLALHRDKFQDIFFTSFPRLGRRLVERIDRRLVYLKCIMQTIVDEFFPKMNLLKSEMGPINLIRCGNSFDSESKLDTTGTFLNSFRSRLED